MYDEIDLEDIECRLYSQVYHFSAENEVVNLPSESTLNTNYKGHNHRYFSRQPISEQPLFISLEEKDSTGFAGTSSVHSSVSFNSNHTNTAREGVLGNHFQNNITVNQYTLPLPLIINPELPEVLNPYSNRKYFVPWCVENKKLLDKKNRKRQKKEKRRRNKEKARLNSLNNLNAGTHTVYISDDSDIECITVNEMDKEETQKNRKLKSGSPNTIDNDESDSDDIIYIPPPPVEIINIDEEEVNEEKDCSEVLKHKNKVTDEGNVSTCVNSDLESNSKTNYLDPDGLSPESCTSNDFLDNSSVDNNLHKFNFGLHGADFNNTGDFVRPANPIEYCETESSCSTNDFNKEGNCVKTIVFSEVDFPKEDIFSDKNLEGFGSYITPKRKALKESKNNNSVLKLPKSGKKVFDCTDSSSPSSSSSETDYESPHPMNKSHKLGARESNKKLPTLSPMLCEKNITKTKSLKDDSVQVSIKKNKQSDKRKCNVFNTAELDNDNDGESKLTKKKISKKKKKSSNKKTSSEYQNKPIEDNGLNKNDTNSEREVENVPTESNTFSKSTSSISDTTFKKDLNCGLSEKDSSNECQKHTKFNENDDHLKAKNMDLESNKSLITPSRRKKKHSDSKKSEVESASSSGETMPEKIKKKKRKSTCSENLGSDPATGEVIELSLEQHGKNDVNVENELGIDKNSQTDNSLNVQLSDNSLRKVSQELNSVQDTSNFTNLTEIQIGNTGEKSTLNEELPVCTKVPDLHIVVDNENNREIVIIDEIVSDESNTYNQNCVEIVSSDSEDDFQVLTDVGNDLKLANCSSHSDNSTHNECINASINADNYAMKKNRNPDFSELDVEQIQSTQTDDPNAWKILPRDQPMFLSTKGSRGPRCNRCRQFGHVAIRCMEKPDDPNCTLCGLSGHQEPRCPYKICTQCGNEGDYSTTYCWKCVKFRNSICHLCNMRGHLAKTCPDLWRRYHLTIKEGPIVVSEEPQLKPRDQLWCSGCAGQGHLEHECDYYNREFPPTNPCIVSYEEVWQQEDRNRHLDHRTVIPTPPPPPAWNTHQQHFYGNMPPAPFHDLPSSSQEALRYIPPLMSHMPNVNSLLPAPGIDQGGDIGFQSNHMDSDLTIGPTKVLNPFSVLITKGNSTELNRMLLDYVNDGNNINHMGRFDERGGKLVIHPHLVKIGANQLLKNDQRRVKQIIMSMPGNVVKQFLGKELADLENIISDTDPKYLKKKLFKYDRISQSKRPLNCEIVKEMCFWNRILNMFIFGVHQFKDGRLHINFIKSFISESKPKLSPRNRKSLLSAYMYIFDASRHNVNYYKVMQNLIQKQNPES